MEETGREAAGWGRVERVGWTGDRTGEGRWAAGEKEDTLAAGGLGEGERRARLEGKTEGEGWVAGERTAQKEGTEVGGWEAVGKEVG